jgi:hypothetical protein
MGRKTWKILDATVTMGRFMGNKQHHETRLNVNNNMRFIMKENPSYTQH